MVKVFLHELQAQLSLVKSKIADLTNGPRGPHDELIVKLTDNERERLRALKKRRSEIEEQIINYGK